MEPVSSLKISLPLHYDPCIICQEDSNHNGPTFDSTTRGIEKIKESTQKIKNAVDRFSEFFNKASNNALIWHRNC